LLAACWGRAVGRLQMLLRNVFPEFSPHKFADISIDILLIPKWFGA
jgi:hypothetical protein